MGVRLELLEPALNAKKSYEDGDLATAWKNWCNIYNEVEKIELSGASKDKLFLEYSRVMALFTDNEVYDITDYGKKINGYA